MCQEFSASIAMQWVAWSLGNISWKGITRKLNIPGKHMEMTPGLESVALEIRVNLSLPGLLVFLSMKSQLLFYIHHYITCKVTYVI